MRLLVRHFDGSLQAAILMAMFGGHLRVSVSGGDDAAEIRWADGQWLAENGDAVKLQFDPAPEEFCRCALHAAEARQGMHAASEEPVN
jgi:hypothetical protein